MAVDLRRGRPADVEPLLGHLRAVFGEDDAARVRDLFDTPDEAARWVLAWDGDELVSCSTLLAHRLHLDGVELRVGQIEWVATAPGHRRQGLVRAMFDEHHRAAAAEGMLVTLVAGIPYLYRRFGYGYALDAPVVVGITPDRDAHTTPVGRDAADPAVRPATTADVDALTAMEDGRTVPVHIVRDRDRWHRRLRTTDPGAEETLLAVDRRSGAIRAWVRLQTYPADGEQYLIWGTTHDDDAARALIGHARRHVPDGLRLVGYGPPGRWVTLSCEHGAVTPYGLGYYGRIVDPVALVSAMVPVLDRRLAAAGRQDSGPLDLSLYDRSVRLELDDGRVVAVTEAPGIEDPFDHDDVGVAPDHLPALLLGRWSATGLAERYDDVTFGRYAQLAQVLFPRLAADVADDL